MIDDKLTAFPNQRAAPDVDGFMSTRGMTLRDYFAAKAMQGYCASIGIVAASAPTDADMARYAYDLADAMLEVRSAS
jgi:hypothetical protein